MKPGKNKKKPEQKNRQTQRMSIKTILLVGSGIFTMTALALVIVNMTNSLSSHAKDNGTIEVVKVSDQEFTTETTLEKPQTIQTKINGEHTILIRDKKVINAQ